LHEAFELRHHLAQALAEGVKFDIVFSVLDRQVSPLCDLNLRILETGSVYADRKLVNGHERRVFHFLTSREESYGENIVAACVVPEDTQARFWHEQNEDCSNIKPLDRKIEDPKD
jgi:hypothetical protein